MIPDETRDRTGVMVFFKIISRHSWDQMQAFIDAQPGSYTEHLVGGCYVVHVPAGGALEAS